MKLRYGNMFDHLSEYDLVLATGNSTLTKSGSVVMGAGAALEMKTLFPGCEREFGRIMKRRGIESGGDYGIMMIAQKFNGVCISGTIGLMQVKRHWRHDADLALIEYGVAEIVENIGTKRIALNYPGIGLGGLSEELVAPIIARLPDNVDVWKLEES